MKNHLSKTLLLQAPNNRHGITLEPQLALTSFSDVETIIHMGVPGSIESPWESASGGIGRIEETARLAAIGEGVERYSASLIQLPLKKRHEIADSQRIDASEWCLFSDEQRVKPQFPFGNIYDKLCPYTNVFDFQTNEQVWVPQPLIALRDDYQTGVPTSSGIAAGPSAHMALLRAIEELIERDALMMTWLHAVAARRIKTPRKYEDEIAKLDGEMWIFDLTPAYSPFPVIAVAGGIKKARKWRYSLGVACREYWLDAIEKAYLEWNQGVLFAGIYGEHEDTENITNPYTVKSFDEHAIFYTINQNFWYGLPMFSNVDTIHPISRKGSRLDSGDALTLVKTSLKKNSIRMYYRDVSTIDAQQLGIWVVRTTSPDLAAIFAHQEWPLIGGVEDKLKSRYPWAKDINQFPNLMPHPLG